MEHFIFILRDQIVSLLEPIQKMRTQKFGHKMCLYFFVNIIVTALASQMP